MECIRVGAQLPFLSNFCFALAFSYFYFIILLLLYDIVGDIVIGPEAKIVQSFNVEGSFVHEVSDLISPTLLWRYCDQLRIL